MAKKKSNDIPSFAISLTLGDKKYESSGATALEALEALPQPVKIFNKGLLTLTHGESKRTQVLMPIRIKRLWWKNARPMLAKGFEQGLVGLK